MLRGLVSVGVVAHVGHLHFGNFVDAEPVVAVVVDGRHDEDRVEHPRESFAFSHQVDQSLDIVEHRPCVVPRVSLGEGVAPLVGAEGRLERPVGIAAPHQARFGIEEVFIVLRSLFQHRSVVRFSQFFRHLRDAPVVVGVFERSGGIFGNIHVIRDISQRIVILIPPAPCGAHRGVYLPASCEHRLVERRNVFLGGDTFQDGIRNDRRRVVSDHAPTVSGRSPFGQKSALAVSVCQPGLNFGIDRRIDQIEQWEQTAEGVPESRVGIHVSRQYLTVVGAVMQDIAVLVDLVELAREQGRTVEARIERAVLVRRASLDFNTSEHLVPVCLRLGLHGFEIVLSQLFEVLHGLHLRYER